MRRDVVIFTPGHVEGLFRAVATGNKDDVPAIADAYSTRLIGPAMYDHRYTIMPPRPPSD